MNKRIIDLFKKKLLGNIKEMNRDLSLQDPLMENNDIAI